MDKARIDKLLAYCRAESARYAMRAYGPSFEYSARMQTTLDNIQEVISNLQVQVEDYDARFTALRNTLTEAGVPDSEDYPAEHVDFHEHSLRAGGRMIPVVKRVALLHERAVKAEERSADLEVALRDVLQAMRLWGSWEDGIPEAGDGAHSSVGSAYDRGVDVLNEGGPKALEVTPSIWKDP